MLENQQRAGEQHPVDSDTLLRAGPRAESTDPLQALLEYPLVAAMANRRSRRFSVGATIPGGGLAYKSRHPPLPLTATEEALLAFAAAGITGLCLGDVPFAAGNQFEAGGGNVMAALTGRTGASADAVHSAALFIINDDGAYLLRRPQDFSLPEIHELAQLASTHAFAQLYDRMRLKLREGRVGVPREVPYVFSFNKWSTNLPGSTYYVPICDLSSMYINVLLSAFDEQMGFFILDERNSFKPAGIARFGRSRGGRLNDDLEQNRVMTVGALETVIVEFMLAEQAFMVHNLSLMEQAMGLGGWTHFATATETAWLEALGFQTGTQRLSQIMNAGFLQRALLRLLGRDQSFPHGLGLRSGGEDVIKPYCPPYFRTMEEAVLAYVQFKRNNAFHAQLAPHFAGSWKEPAAVQGKIPAFSEECIAATIDYCTYLYQTYGRFPSHYGPTRTTLAHQAHHLDLEFYDKFYHRGAYTRTQQQHFARWHGSACRSSDASNST